MSFNAGAGGVPIMQPMPAGSVSTSLSTLDWAVLACYLALVVGTGIWFSRRKQAGTEDYFLAGRRMPVWAVAISIIATSISAATFIGGPEQAFRSNLTYLFSNAGGLIAVVIVAIFFIPVFYRHNVGTIYELLEIRFGQGAKFAASGAFLIGRVFASGARVYIAAIPLSMLFFGDTGATPPDWQLWAAIGVLTLVAVAYTLAGGVESVIWTEVFQTGVLLVSVIGALIVLFMKIPADTGQIIDTLRHAGPEGSSKLTLIDTSLDFSKPYTLLSCVIAFALMGLASYGTDHDLVQRMLTCRNAVAGGKSVVVAILASLPIVALFMAIGLLLFVFYRRPDVMGAAAPAYQTSDSRQVFLTFILKEMPRGMSGLMIAGLCSVGISSLASALNAMGAAFVRDFYRHGAPGRSDRHYLRAGRMSVVGWGVVLGGFACLCVIWQRESKQSLIDFALSVMTFAYAGLLAVFITAIFTRRGTSASAVAALVTGFAAIALMQKPVWTRLYELSTWTEHTQGAAVERSLLPAIPPWDGLAYPWHLAIAASAALLVCIAPSGSRGVGRVEP